MNLDQLLVLTSSDDDYHHIRDETRKATLEDLEVVLLALGATREWRPRKGGGFLHTPEFCAEQKAIGNDWHDNCGWVIVWTRGGPNE